MTEVVQRHVRKRGFFGKLFKFLFVAFNILMLVWVISYWVTLGGMLNSSPTDATKTGMEIGAAIGTGALLFLWMAGSVILGLITLLSRGSITVIQKSKANPTG